MRVVQQTFLFLLFSVTVFAQKKPLDHSVYDGWQSIGERMISPDGMWVVYTVCPQEGDTTLFIQGPGTDYKKEIPRGYNATITKDNRFVVFKIKPFQKELKEARMKNKKGDDLPKDTLGIVELGKDVVTKIAKVRSYKIPEDAGGYVAYWMEKSKDAASSNDAADLVLLKLGTVESKTFNFITEYYFDKSGNKLLMETGCSAKDSLMLQKVLLYHLSFNKVDTISSGGNDFKGYEFDEDGSQLAFLAERDAEPKALQKYYKLWYYNDGMDSARMIVDKNAVGMHLGMTVSEYGNLRFSKSGNRLFFGVAEIRPPKDTLLVEADLVKMDIWNYKDDYLQTQQIVQLNNTLRRSYLTYYDLDSKTIHQLGSPEIPQVLQTDKGDGNVFVGISDVKYRKESQWTGNARDDIYAINVKDGSKKLIKEKLHGQVYPSSTGKYIMWYDRPAKQYFVWDGSTVKNISSGIKYPLWNEEFDTPDNPTPYGVMGWYENDSAVFIYDKYDIWKIYLIEKRPPANITVIGRRNKSIYRPFVRDPEKEFYKGNESFIAKIFFTTNKTSGLAFIGVGTPAYMDLSFGKQNYLFSNSISKNEINERGEMIFTMENFKESPNLYFCGLGEGGKYDPLKPPPLMSVPIKLSSINPQQKDYNWGTSELVKWTTPAGKTSEGILFKPENFDPNKKYPVLIYFYEKLSDNLNQYVAPAPPRSAINTSYFVSNGYIVFQPNISYGTGHPGKDAYDYVVSGAKALISKYKWIDGNRMGIQGHSWGGYQVAYIITKTNTFKAAWSGAPVVNMTSAYGGIRYGTGISRQFQYEKTQSRIGKNLWEAFPQYIESSPLFSLNKVKTPVVILHNDNDDAVPYTQGIEMFTALKRLNKRAWLISYNGEPHGVMQRKNRKDLAMRFEQFFGWLLKDEPPARWLEEGVPATLKGKDWGLDIE